MHLENQIVAKGSMEECSKYNSSDGKKVLDLEDDAANVNLHGNWRIPTYEEAKELIENCDVYKDASCNGKWGTAMISKKTGNVLFLSEGISCYWTSSLCENLICAYDFEERADDRYDYHYIRPVQGTSSGGNTDENKIDISVTDITSTTCVVSLHPNVSGTYFWDIIEKDTFDKYGGDYVLNYYVSYYKEEGLLGNVLDNGDSTYDYKELTSKTQYVVFAGYCDANANVKSKVSSKTFTTK